MKDQLNERFAPRDQAPNGRNMMLPILILCVPAFSLLGYWVGGEKALLAIALGLPLIGVTISVIPTLRLQLRLGEGHTVLLSPSAFDDIVKTTMEDSREKGLKSAVFYVKVDDFDALQNHFGEGALDRVMMQVSGRLQSKLRGNDVLGSYGLSGFSLCIAPQPLLDLEICLEMASRLSRSITEPYSVDGTSIYLTPSVGFCQLGREDPSAATPKSDAVSECAKIALGKALASAPSAIRAYTPDSNLNAPNLHQGSSTAVMALEAGEIVPWYQPQISTDTGQITGFETLARWIHPQRGVIAPGEFLPDLEAANAMHRLSEVMLYHAFSSLKAWDEADLEVCHAGVNFSSAELNDPHLVEKISWELDRFELTPSRLAVEVLETVVSHSPDDVITRNIKGLSDLGCQIDLDDFGTGHASLASIRRFGVSRIKIDRSFVMKADRDTEQQRMIKAILTMAEKLNLQTLAEGVETVGEHSLLAQLGCSHVQGFGIGRPMPFDETIPWIRAHLNRLQPPPDIGQTQAR